MMPQKSVKQKVLLRRWLAVYKDLPPLSGDFLCTRLFISHKTLVCGILSRSLIPALTPFPDELAAAQRCNLPNRTAGKQLGWNVNPGLGDSRTAARASCTGPALHTPIGAVQRRWWGSFPRDCFPCWLPLASAGSIWAELTLRVCSTVCSGSTFTSQ